MSQNSGEFPSEKKVHVRLESLKKPTREIKQTKYEHEQMNQEFIDQIIAKSEALYKQITDFVTDFPETKEKISEDINLAYKKEFDLEIKSDEAPQSWLFYNKELHFFINKYIKKIDSVPDLVSLESAVNSEIDSEKKQKLEQRYKKKLDDCTIRLKIIKTMFDQLNKRYCCLTN